MICFVLLLTRQRFVEGGILPHVQLVHDHLPHGVAAGGAVLEVAVALVRHAEVQGVRPERRVRQRSRHRRVVQERLLFHHCELSTKILPSISKIQREKWQKGHHKTASLQE